LWKRNAAILIVIVSALAYEPLKMENTSGDTIGGRLLPVAVLRDQSLLLNRFRERYQKVRFAYMLNPNGDAVARYPAPILFFSLPVFALVDPFIDEWSIETINRVSRWNGFLLAILANLFLF
jgi:hypothetical protein